MARKKRSTVTRRKSKGAVWGRIDKYWTRNSHHRRWFVNQWYT